MISYNKRLTPSQTQRKIVIQGNSMNIRHVIDLLNRAELYEESSAVLAIVQQNKELLEALKEAQKTMETIEDRLMGLEYAEARYFARQGASSSKAAINYLRKGSNMLNNRISKQSHKIVLTTKKGSATFPTNVKQPVAQEKLWWQYWK